MVEPSPGENGLARFGIGRDGEVQAIASLGTDAIALERLDNFEGLAAIER
jgi:hypothetical protein